MRKFPGLLVLIAIQMAAWSVVAAQSDDKAVIDKFIAARAAKESGEEPDGIRKVVEGDLNHDGVADTAVVYTIEGQGGSNNYVQYLAVFLRKSGQLVYAARQPVGGKNRREIDLTGIKDNAVLLDTTAYGPKDPSCCPTIKGKTSFVLTGGRLIEKRRK